MSEMKIPPDSDMKKILDMAPVSGRGKLLKRLLLWGGPLLLVLAIVLKLGVGQNGSAMQYKTVPAQQGDLTVIVTATGNLQPTNQVDVGTEVSGTVKTVLVDYNDVVKAGQVLARLDTTKLEAQANRSRAGLESARASLLQAQASLFEKKNEYDRLGRLRELSDGKTPSRQDLDAAESAFKSARADEAIARAKIAEAEAALRVDETNLEKAVIFSPINGVVLKRSVEPGQTVAASLQAPVLFTLAEDLAKMELHVDVDEADVGQVQQGQRATFTVDAYPDRTFPAHITQVRYGSQTSEGVITYLTVLNVDNSDLSLRPGMTATADVVVKELKDVLLVPNSALRFAPVQQEAKSGGTEGGSLLSKLFPRPRHTKSKKNDGGGDKKKQRVWILRDGQPVAVPVSTGATSGIMTEILGGDVKPGMELVVEAVSKGK